MECLYFQKLYPSPDAHICEDGKINAATTMMDGYTYLFKGNHHISVCNVCTAFDFYNLINIICI